MTAAEQIARDHVTWALADGRTPAQIIIEAGGVLPAHAATVADAVAAVAAAWVALTVEKRKTQRNLSAARLAAGMLESRGSVVREVYGQFVVDGEPWTAGDLIRRVAGAHGIGRDVMGAA